MTIESRELFELCKQVYEATGWKGLGRRYINEPLEKDDWIPIYTSDYLLEKLPATVKNDFDGGDDYLILYKKGKSWYSDYMGQFKRQKSDMPLKALLKLTIKLHEEGLL